MRFRFRLQRVLGVRESFEKMRAAELAQAAAAERDATAARDAAEARLEARRASSTLGTGATMTAGMLHNLGLTVRAADHEATVAEDTRAAAHDAAEESGDRYLDARRDRRVLERLRDGRHESWQEDEERRDRRAMDDIAQAHVQRHQQDSRAA